MTSSCQYARLRFAFVPHDQLNRNQTTVSRTHTASGVPGLESQWIMPKSDHTAPNRDAIVATKKSSPIFRSKNIKTMCRSTSTCSRLLADVRTHEVAR